MEARGQDCLWVWLWTASIFISGGFTNYISGPANITINDLFPDKLL